MLPGIMTGDYLFASKFAYGLRVPFSDSLLGDPIWLSPPKSPKTGDIVIFESPELGSTTLLIKRVIALPGDTVRTEGKNIFLNGVALPKTALSSGEQTGMIADPGFDPDERYDKTKIHIFEETLGPKKYKVLEDDSFEAKRDIPETKVGPDSVYVIGDNRDDTRDSRDFGPVPFHNLRGKAVVIWLSYRISFRDSNWSFRSDRVGKVVQ